MEELTVLEDQLEELLEEGAIDPEDALEIALVAGMAQRLGSKGELMAEALAWKVGPGKELLDEAWAELDHDGIVADFDEGTDGTTDEEEVEEAVYDIDELIAGAIWCGRAGAVARIARHVADSIRMMPEVFSHMRDDAKGMTSLESVGSEYALYDLWFAIAEIDPDIAQA